MKIKLITNKYSLIIDTNLKEKENNKHNVIHK